MYLCCNLDTAGASQGNKWLWHVSSLPQNATRPALAHAVQGVLAAIPNIASSEPLRCRETHLLCALLGLAARLGLSRHRLGRLAQRRFVLLLRWSCRHHWLPLSLLWRPACCCTRYLACSSGSMAAPFSHIWWHVRFHCSRGAKAAQNACPFCIGQAGRYSRWPAGRRPRKGLGEGRNNAFYLPACRLPQPAISPAAPASTCWDRADGSTG